MIEAMHDRRRVLRGAAAFAATTAILGAAGSARAQHNVRWSAGTAAPRTPAPPNATDCHFHIYDDRFPVAASASLKPPAASVEDYHALQRRLGLTRCVLIQPSTYGTDNRAYLGLLPALGGAERARMVAVVDPSVTDQDLRRMHEAGVRGIRFNLGAQAGATTIDMIEPLSRRVDPMGWHCQVNMDGRRLVEAQDLFLRLPGKLVFDHIAHVPQPEGVNSPTFALVRRLLDKGNTWVKLSGAYFESKTGAPTYADNAPVVRGFVQAAPERCVWGTDWPHPTEAADKKPDDAVLFDLLAEWVPDTGTRNRILVDNPAELYGFPRG